MEPIELTKTGLHELANGDTAGSPHDPALAVYIPAGDWTLAQISARLVLLAPGAHLTLCSPSPQASEGFPLVSHLYDLQISQGAVLDDINNALQENVTFVAPGGTLNLHETAGNESAILPIKLGTLINGGSMTVDTVARYSQNIQLAGSHVDNFGYLLQMP